MHDKFVAMIYSSRQSSIFNAYAKSIHRLLLLSITFTMVMIPVSSFAVINLTPVDHKTIRRQDVGAYYFDGTIASIQVGANSSPRFFRNVAEFDISSLRNDILNAASIKLNYQVTLIAGGTPDFNSVDLYHIDSSLADGVVTGSTAGARNTDGSDYSADATLVVKDYDIEGGQVGDALSFDITDSLKSDAANQSIIYSAYRMQMPNGIDFGNEQGKEYGPFIRFATLGDENSAFIEITPGPIPEPGMTTFILVCAAFSFCLVRRNLISHRD